MAAGGQGRARWRSGCRSSPGITRALWCGKYWVNWEKPTVTFHKTTKHQNWKDLQLVEPEASAPAPLGSHFNILCYSIDPPYKANSGLSHLVLLCSEGQKMINRNTQSAVLICAAPRTLCPWAAPHGWHLWAAVGAAEAMNTSSSFQTEKQRKKSKAPRLLLGHVKTILL